MLPLLVLLWQLLVFSPAPSASLAGGFPSSAEAFGEPIPDSDTSASGFTSNSHAAGNHLFHEHFEQVPLHQRQAAGRALRHYASFHQKQRGLATTLSSSSSLNDSSRFIIMAATSTGIGNFYLKLASAVLLGLLTDRAVLVDGRSRKSGQYLEMFDLPLNVSLDGVPGAAAATDAVLSLRQESGAEALQRADTYTFARAKFPLCADINATFGDVRFVVLRDFWYGGLPLWLWRSAVHLDYVERVFSSVPFFFLYNWLFERLASANVRHLYEVEYRRIFASTRRAAATPIPGSHVALGNNVEDEVSQAVEPPTFVLGMQVRWGRGLKDFYLSTAHDVRKFWICAASVLRSHALRGTRVAVFMATDKTALREEFQAWLARHPDPRLQNVTVFHLSPDHSHGLRADGDMHLALVDQLLLSHADDFIATRWSTFGYNLQVRTLMKPLYASRLSNSCLRMVSSHQGLNSLGGGWPWGESACDKEEANMPCCMEQKSRFFSHFLPI